MSVKDLTRPHEDWPCRFLDKIAAPDDDSCWEWMAFRKPNGYGQFDRNKYAHRVAYELFFGPIPTGLVIDHLCKNEGCVNPAHLEAVTQRENNLRSNSLSSRRARQTHCKRGHELAGENLEARGGHRRCRECRRLRDRERYHERKAA